MNCLQKHPFQVMLPLVPALLVLAGLPAAHAATLYSTSFENPPFVTGSIAGQDGWAVFGPSNPLVENFFAYSGTQAVFVDGGTASQSGPYHSDSSTGPLVDLSAEIAIFTASTQSEWQFAGLGSSVGPFLGGIDIFSDNTIEAITAGFPVIGTFPRATGFNQTAWVNINLLFDIPSQTYSITLDGSLLASNLPFCGDNGPCAGAYVSSYGAGFFDSFGAASTGGPTANDSGYMDNYQVANVPEPAAMLLVGIGLAAVWLRKREE